MTAGESRSVGKASLTASVTSAKPILFAAGLGLLAVGGAWFLWRASAGYGIGIGTDTVVYISGARHWLAGQGISWVTGGMQVDPILRYPPLFPLLLAGMQLLGVDVLQAARLVNVLAYGLNAAVLGWVLHRITGGYLLPLAGAALMLVSPGIFSLHADGMTDGLYLVLTSIALYFMSRHLRDGGLRALFVSAIAGGLAYLLRYAGIALILVLGLGLVLGSRGRWRETLRAAAILAAVSIAPMVVWYVRNLRLAGVTSDMHLLAHGQHGLAFADGYRMILDWFLPGLVVQRVTAIPLLAPLLVVGLALAALVYGVGVLRRRWAWRPANAGGGELLGLHAIHFGPYAVFLYATAASYSRQRRSASAPLPPRSSPHSSCWSADWHGLRGSGPGSCVSSSGCSWRELSTTRVSGRWDWPTGFGSRGRGTHRPRGWPQRHWPLSMN